MDAESETSPAAAEADSPTDFVTAPDSSQKSLTQPHNTDVNCRHGLRSGSLAASALGSKVQQQAQHRMPKGTSASRSDSVLQAESTDTTGSQQSHARDQPSDGKRKPNVTPAATACKPLVPIFSRHKQHVFKPPAVVPGHEGNRQIKTSLRQTSSSVQAAQGTDSKPAIVFDKLHAVARHVAVPTSFAKLHSYQQSWCGAVTEEINIRCIPELSTLKSAFHGLHSCMSPGKTLPYLG